MALYHVDGELVPAGEAAIPVRDRGFLYGDAAFETLRAYGGTVFEWEAHAARLAETCSILGIDRGPSEADLRGRVEETLAANDLDDAYVRLSVTRGSQPGKLTPRPDADTRVVVIVDGLPSAEPNPDRERVWDEPATVAIPDTRRVPDEAIPARAKTHNYLNGILARLELRGSDADEAVMLDAGGHLAEGATSNLFFVRDGTLHTPSTDRSVLPGVTRSVVWELAADRDVPVRTGRYSVADLLAADEAFLTNTTWEIRPIARIDDEFIGPGPITETLIEAFDERVSRCYR